MKYLFLSIFFFLNTPLFSQIIYEKTQKPNLKIADWNWIKTTDTKKDLAGKHLVLEFWASWCPGCLEAIPHINELTEVFSEDISFVSINSYDTQSRIEKLLQKHKMNSYVVMDQDKYLLDLFKIQLIPVTILIDKNGVLRWRGLAPQLTTELLEEFVRNDTIHSVVDTILVDQTFMIKDLTEKTQIPVRLKTTRLIRDQFQTSTTSLNINFDNSPIIDMKNWSIQTIFKRLLVIEKEETLEVSFKGKVPKNFNVDFLATSDQKVEKTFFLSQTIKAFANALNVSIDTSQVQKSVQLLSINSNRLQSFLSPDQEGDLSTKEVGDQYAIQNLTLKELGLFINQLTNEEILFQGDNKQKYNLNLLKTSDLSVMKNFLKTQYGMEFQPKEITKEQYEFTFH